MARAATQDSLAIHKRVGLAMRRLSAKSGPALRIQQVAKAVGSDPRTVRHHLEIMAADRQVIFLDAARTVVARFADLELMMNRQMALREKEELGYASAASGASLVWPDEA